MEHISFDKILSYTENLLDLQEKNHIETHIATCDRCHGIFMGLKSVEAHLEIFFKQNEISSKCPKEWELGALIRNELNPDITEGLSDHIHHCSACLERAVVLYKAVEVEEAPFKATRAWKRKAVQVISRQEESQVEASLLDRIKVFFTELAIPLPAAAGYAAALLAIAVFAWTTEGDKTKIITVASSEKITIRASEVPSAFGFTGAGITKEVENMEITIKGNDIVFRWRPIEGASGYTFSLVDNKKMIYSYEAEGVETVLLDRGLIKENNLYSWIISGAMEDGKYYEYSGDFLIAE